MAEKSTKVAIIGAGISGLATAGLLARDGFDVEVFEALAAPGGRAGVRTHGGYRFDTGPSWYLMPDAYDHFFELMGTSTAKQLDLRPLDPGYRVFPEKLQPVDVPQGVDAAAALFESFEPGAGQELRDYLATADLVYRLAVETFLYTTFSDPRPFFSAEIRRRALLLIRLLFTSLKKHVEARFSDRRLRQILQYPAVFLSGRPSTVPAIYHLMSHTDITQGVRFPIGGFAAVVDSLESLATAAGARITYGAEVKEILLDGHRTRGLRLVDRGGDDVEIAADIVISCADLHHTETALLPDRAQTYPESYWQVRNPGIGTVLVLAGIRGELPELLHHNLFFSADWERDFDAVFDGARASKSIYVSRTSATESDTAPHGCENLFILIPVPADEDFGSQEKFDSIGRAALRQVGSWAGIDDLEGRAEFFETIGPRDFAEKYHAWSGGAIGPAHTLMQSAFLRGKNKSSRIKGLYYAGGTTVPGVGVPMCLISAENVLTRLREDGIA